jgi:hypothetical protein
MLEGAFELLKTDGAAVLPQLVNEKTAQGTFFPIVTSKPHFHIVRFLFNRYSYWVT